MPRYDHPNFIVRRDLGKTSTAGASSVLRFASYVRRRLKAVHFLPIVAGTATAFTVAAASISGTTTTALGTHTLGTAAVAGGLRTLLVGTANSPRGVTFAAGDLLTLTNATDATGVYEAIPEYEALPDSAFTA